MQSLDVGRDAKRYLTSLCDALNEHENGYVDEVIFLLSSGRLLTAKNWDIVKAVAESTKVDDKHSIVRWSYYAIKEIEKGEFEQSGVKINFCTACADQPGILKRAVDTTIAQLKKIHKCETEEDNSIFLKALVFLTLVTLKTLS